MQHEASQLPNFQVFAAQHLKQVCEHLSQNHAYPTVINPQHINSLHSHYKFDLADVKGQLRPRRALELRQQVVILYCLKVHQGQGKRYWLHV